MTKLTTRLMILALLWLVSPTVVVEAAAETATTATQQLLKPEQLEQLVAPVALYPDALLAEVLMASTYPLEVVQADRWASQNKSLAGDQLKAAVDKQSWDASVKALVATASVLSMMSTKLDWTQKLGDTVLAQQGDVMDAVQRLRAKAQAQNQLPTTKEQKVSSTQQEGKTVIVIEPTVPNTIYVPYYNPAVVYGTWPYAAYPPYYYPPPPGYVAGSALARGMAFGAGVALTSWAFGGNHWGGGMNWGGGNINVNRPINVNNVNVSNWQHNSEHRGGVRYNNADVQKKFSKNDIHANKQSRQDFRGRDSNNPNTGNRGGGDRRPAGAGASKGGGPKGPPAARQKGGGEGAFAHVDPKGKVKSHEDRGRNSVSHAGGGGPRAGGGGQRPRAGGGGGNRGGGGRRR